MANSQVVVNVDEKFDDETGPYDVISYWDGNEILTETLTAREHQATPKVNATHEQKSAAAEWFRQNVRKPLEKAFGHKYTVGGSRKVQKGEVVELIDYIPAYFDNRYYQRVQAQVEVRTRNGEVHKISPNCLKTWVEGTYPWWFRTE